MATAIIFSRFAFSSFSGEFSVFSRLITAAGIGDVTRIFLAFLRLIFTFVTILFWVNVGEQQLIYFNDSFVAVRLIGLSIIGD
jgi:Na+/alanine symporter